MIIIGAGVAGLAAARALALKGVPALILEARDRVGGRIHTVRADSTGVPIELGAEFIHGASNPTWELIRAAKLGVREAPDRYWKLEQGKLVRDKHFWDELSAVFQRINTASPDQDLQSFLDQAWGLSDGIRQLAVNYVEGFHAAPAGRIGTHALALAEAAAERDRATHQFRLTKGYSALVDWLINELGSHTVEVWTNTIVRLVRWEPGHVEIVTSTSGVERVFRSGRVLITLPLGVLKQTGPGAVIFAPKLKSKERAIRGLALGSVVKISLEFRSCFWPVGNFGFIHLDTAPLPVWWSEKRALVLTGWAGGPKADALRSQGSEAILDIAIRTLSALFKTELEKIRELLVSAHTHDWALDPFTLGAYSYTPARMTGLPARLAAPVSNTLFFAGEATDSEGEQGTVHGALASGERAAQEILESLPRPSLQERQLEMKN